MSTRTTSARQVVPWRRLVMLIVLSVALIASLLLGTLTTDRSRWIPEFALDLEGGTQIILTPTTTDGSEITQEDVNQAIEIIRQRVDASGVSEAEITSEGGQNIVVGLPGEPSQETLDLVRTSAVLRMRPVLTLTTTGSGALTPATVQAYDEAQASASASAEATDTASATPSESASPEASASASASPSANATYSQAELEEQAKRIADADGDGVLSDTPTTTPENASDTAWITEKVYYESLILDCTNPNTQSTSADDPAVAVAACGSSGEKYILGPAEVEGTNVTQATSGYDSTKSLWVVNLELNSAGADAFAAVTGRLVDLDSPQDKFAIVLDGKVISAPAPNAAITGGKAMISGDFTSDEAATLANQLNFGSLPLNFEVQSEEQISATLGSESLTSGLIAGLIGLALVVLYLLWQYHGLGFVAAGSVMLATGLSYLIVSLLSWTIGYRLSLAGVVGLIISVGITADSFIVFFERIRDEIREGRTLSAAVSHGWHRAKRTIFVADGVNLLCSIVLYFLAVGSVRGFAFTLGITTVLDLVIVLMFTYPIMTLLVRTKFFGEGHRFSGMDPAALGRTPVYRGRGSALDRGSKPAKETRAEQIASAVEQGIEDSESSSEGRVTTPAPKKTAVATLDARAEDAALVVDENGNRLSLAERRAQERRRAAEGAADSDAETPESDDSATESKEEN